MRGVLATFVVIGLLIAFGIVMTPKSSWHSADAPPSPAEQRLQQDEAIRVAERDAHNKRVMECVPAGAENLNPKIFSAMVDDCEREALVQAAHEESEEVRMKEKWSAPPLHADDEFAEEEATSAEIATGQTAPLAHRD